ncbi:MAG: Si-specific NAD(P)(+) transhydrogenase [Gammaproteobacteria bacterium]|nr:Si-specific NAD(P)(+) transhydrogenase [Gammaproteobacteria bacterium]MDH3447775.1 Si-specific NAD(P)(+) transhydrogenase [Gammaproteobacteria bacterium]
MIVIGSGPAGKRAAIQAAKIGKNVLLVEKNQIVGGVTVHTGTIPSKTLRETVLFLSGWRQRGIYGLSYKVKDTITADDLKQRLMSTLNHEIEIIQHQLMRNNVEIQYGHARFSGEHSISVETVDGNFNEFSADFFVICVGTRTRRPKNVPFDGDAIMDSDEILELNRIPRKMLVVGSGVIGIEYATIFKALDIEVTMLESGEYILGFVDREIVDELIHHLRDCNIQVRLNDQISTINKFDDGKVVVKFRSGKSMAVDTVLFAAGRQGVTDDLALDQVGIVADNRGRIIVNEDYQTAVSHIYAAGDVIGFPSLASTSMEQGRHAACHAFGAEVHSQPELFPYGIYAVPEISMVGLTEQECKERSIAYEVGIARFRETARGQIIGLREGMLKMLFSIETQRLLGVHIIGEGATELVHIGQAVISLGGTLDYFVQTVFNYPTLAEAYKIAALDAYNRMTF